MKSVLLIISLFCICCLSCLAQTPHPVLILTAEQVEPRVLELLCAGKQTDAEAILETHAPRYRTNQRIVFLYACCMRSRFEVEEAAPVFAAVAKMGTNTVSGQCAFHVLCLDAKKDVHNQSAALQKLVESNTNDLMLRWMIAVECRSFKQNEEGARHYKTLLEHWNPGPVLVHQTYGNLLDGLHRFEEALVERRKAVELEPAGWSYEGLGNTLASLDRYSEANEAYEKSVKCDPDRAAYWRSWAWGLLRAGKYPEAIEKCKKAIALDPEDARAWSHWGDCLKHQGKFQDALVKFNKAIEFDNTDVYTRNRIKEVESEIAAQKTSGTK